MRTSLNCRCLALLITSNCSFAAQPALVTFVAAYPEGPNLRVELSEALNAGWILEESGTSDGPWSTVQLADPEMSNRLLVPMDRPERHFRARSAAIPDLVSPNQAAYLRKDLPSGISLVANPLDNGHGNSVSELVESADLGSLLFKFSAENQQWSEASQLTESGWGPELTLNPGEGAMLLSGPSRLAFAGVYFREPDPSLSLHPGWNLVGLPFGLTELHLEHPPLELDSAAVYLWSPETGFALYQLEFGSWTPSVPHLDPGMGCWTVVEPGSTTPPKPTILLSNWAPPASLNAPVYGPFADPLRGPCWGAQLYAGTSDNTLAPIGTPTPFGRGSTAGRVELGHSCLVALDVPPNTTVSATIRFWDLLSHTSWEEAMSQGSNFGNTETVSITPSSPPWVPSVLSGLTPVALPSATTPRPPLPPVNGLFELSLAAPNCCAYTVGVSPNLEEWAPLTAGSNWLGYVQIADTNATTPDRFYRLDPVDP